ncbi:MAG: methyltransferase [Prevotella sp.]|nr:methyltransferase [Prevotella sp.]
MFRFKRFTVRQEQCAMKVGMDGVILGAWAKGGQRILDVGTGTGLIALMMAQRYEDAVVTGIDIDEGAVTQARENITASPFKDRIQILHEAVQQHKGVYDAIVSNPPYFVDSLKAPDHQRNTARHADNLSYAELMQAAYRLLSDGGELSVVVPFDYKKRMEDEATFVGFFPYRVLGVRTVSGKPAKRYLLSFVKHPMEKDFQVITLDDQDYKALTQDFYL